MKLLAMAVTIIMIMAISGRYTNSAWADDNYKDNSSKLKQLFIEYAKTPLDESIAIIAPILINSQVILPQKGAVQTAATGGKTYSLMTAKDKNGLTWYYAYTDTAELTKVFSAGTPYIEGNFLDVVRTIESDKSIGGIYINSGSDAFYLIPNEYFHILTEKAINSKDANS